jgi:hypothetical protein
MPLTDTDDIQAWLEDHAIAIWNRSLTPGTELDTWTAYYQSRGATQTVLNFWTNKPTN